MSTEPPVPPSPAVPRAELRQRARFRRLTVLVIAALVVSAGVLSVANAVQSPRLSSAGLNEQALVQWPGQRVILRTNQPVQDVGPDQWSITPDAAAELSVSGSELTVRFADFLDYATEYTVSVQVAGVATGASGTVEFSFTTPDPFVYSLLRGDDSDRILRDTVSGAGGADAVFEAPLLQEFAVLGEFLAVVMLDELAAPTLSLVRMSDGSILQVPTPVALTIRSVRGSTQSNLLGYIVEHSLVGAAADDESGVASTLFVYDLSDASGVAMEITGIGGAPLTVVDWSFVPGTGSIVAHGDDQQLYLINPLISADAAPLGQHAELRGFVPGTARLIVADLDGGTVLDLAAGTNEPITLPEPDLPPELLPGKQVFLTDDSFFHLRNRVDYQTSTVSTSLYVTDARGTRQVFAPSGGSGRILDYCLSPNAEFLAVEVVSAEGVPDGYPVKTGFSATSVHLVRVDDALGGEAQTERLLNGFAPDWCGR